MKSTNWVALLRLMISKQPHHSVVNLFRFAQQQLKRESKSRKRTKLKVLINAAKKREPIHVMTKSAMIMEGGAVLLNSINRSLKSYDSWGRAFITILSLCVKPLR